MSAIRSDMNRYLQWVFRSQLFPQLIGSFGTSTINQLTQSTLRGVFLGVPPREERNRIDEYLTHRVQDHHVVISRLRHAGIKSLDLVSRLTSDVVTGKLDVREVAAALPEELDDIADAGDDESLEIDGDLAGEDFEDESEISE